MIRRMIAVENLTLVTGSISESTRRIPLAQ